LGPSTAKKYKPLQIELAEALRNKKITVVHSYVLRNKNGVKIDELNPHAELKILQELIDRGINDKNYLIGVSKKCCENCEMSMRAVNQIKGTNGTTFVKVTDEGSKAPFPADPPPFLLCDAKVASRYLQLIGANFTNLRPSLVKKAFKRHAGRDVSGAEQDPTSSDSIDVASDPIESDNNNDEKPLYTDLIQMNSDKTNLTPSYNKILPKIKPTTETNRLSSLPSLNSQPDSQSTETQKDSKKEKPLLNVWLNGSERIKKLSENKTPPHLPGNSKDSRNKSNKTEITDQSDLSNFSLRKK
jgi:hypothetical protein